MNQFSLSLRPRKLEDVVGHSKVIYEFMKRSKSGEWPQAMMMQGFTGTGKTTTGYIVASLINCSSPIKCEDGHFEPCGECASCKAVIEERFGRSIKQYDCSTMGKDDVLALEKDVNSRSLFPGEKTILILEEAQQLASAGARGALLKLLEKPRKNVHFILLTMDEKKFDKAIRDRCQVYRFKKHTSSDISEYLFKVLEEIDPDEMVPDSFIEEVIPVLVQNSDGSLRKALEDFERCWYSEIWTSEDAISEIGYIDEKAMYETLNMLAQKDVKAFDQIGEYESLTTFFNYSWKILSNVEVASIKGYPTDWQEKRGNAIVSTGNLQSLVDVYLNTDKLNSGYFNDKVFLHYLSEYYSGKKINYEDSSSSEATPVTRTPKTRVRKRATSS